MFTNAMIKSAIELHNAGLAEMHRIQEHLKLDENEFASPEVHGHILYAQARFLAVLSALAIEGVTRDTQSSAAPDSNGRRNHSS